jgi:polyhydroxybutyrate depolymerase
MNAPASAPATAPRFACITLLIAAVAFAASCGSGGGSPTGTGGDGGSAGSHPGTGGSTGGTGAGTGGTGAGTGGTGAGTGGTGAGTGGSGAGTGGTRAGTGGGTGGTNIGTGGVGGSGSGGGGAGGGGHAGAGGSGSGGSGGSTISCTGRTAVAGETNQTIQVGGTSRTYILHIPTGYSGKSPVPLVLDFHPLGGTGSGEKSLSGFAALSDSNGFIIAWPNGIDNAWNIGPCCTNSRTVDDLGFAKGMVAAIEASACVDPKHVYSTGFSMGGGMSHYLACNAADIFAAVTPSSFDLLVDSEEPCSPSRPISELSFRGTADTEVPYNGGPGPSGKVDFLGAVGTFMKWSMLDGCTGSPTTSGMEQLYAQCSAGVEVGLYTIQGGGHAPGPADTAWAFLKSKSLP